MPDIPNSYEEKKARCKQCKHLSDKANWSWPCSACSGGIGNLEKPIKDYFSDKPKSQKYKVYFYHLDSHQTIIEPPTSIVIFAKSEIEAESKFKYAYQNRPMIFGWAENMEDHK